MDIMNALITTDRLILRPIEESDAEAAFQSLNTAVTRYMYPQPATEVSKTRSWIVHSIKQMKEGSNVQMVVLDRESKDFLGCAGLHNIHTETPEFGIWLKMDAHGHGYGREAIHALHQWALQNLEYDYIKYPVDRRNIASRKIPESLGGVIEKEYESPNAVGKMLDIVEYWIYPKEQK